MSKRYKILFDKSHPTKLTIVDNISGSTLHVASYVFGRQDTHTEKEFLSNISRVQAGIESNIRFDIEDDYFAEISIGETVLRNDNTSNPNYNIDSIPTAALVELINEIIKVKETV
ncbi:MAG: hypothetical protein N2691_05405 [Patescibacteria group bacterium]|nr:hypothetical protein [Patescibacteria group bacterium]